MSFVKSWTRRLFFLFKGTAGETLALTTTNFIELNVKRGQQFEIREKYGPVAIDGGTDYLLVRTGNDPVILKRRLLISNTDEVDFKVSRNPTITADGTPIFVRNYNEAVSKTAEVTIFKGPTFSDAGTLRAQDYLPGSVNAGNRSAGSFSQEGFERILNSNTEYLLEITNNSSTNPLNYYIELSWYEGPIVPLGDEEVIPTT